MAACPCKTQAPEEPLPVVTGPACPIENQQAKTCSKCKKALPECNCKKEKATCPKTQEKKNCERSDEVSCDKPATPSTALCPQSGKPDKAEMKQVYAYPQAIYGTNNYVGETANSIFSTETAMKGTSASKMSSNISGATVATEGQITGAATQMPCLNEAPNTLNGITVDRNEARADGNNCPIDIQTSNSINAVKKTLVPYEIPQQIQNITGAASSLGGCMFPDVPNSHWAACNIDKLAINDVVVGYPDGLFKPNKNISRAEFATMLVKGFNLNCGELPRETMFSDVPRSNWANPAIAKAVDEDLLTGYPNHQFKPNAPVSRVEALTSIAKGMTCDMDKCKADEILSKYSDGYKVPDWARIPVAKSLENGALKDSPTPNMILPNKDASRAEIASMMQTVRVALGYDVNPKTANNICPACPVDKNAFVEHEEVVTIPTLKLAMIDQLTAKSSHVGQYFRANTLEDVTINGVTYPCGSTVTGQVVEVIRPSGNEKGALKLAFTDIKNGDNKTKLPKQILQAQINKSKTVNPVARLVEMPFTWAGSLIGVVGRTAGGMVSNLGNAVENISNDTGYMLGHAFQGEFGAAARSLGDGLFETVKAPVDVTRTALSGSMGLFQTTSDEFAYLVDPHGYKISAVNPREQITIAFGCSE
jgi:hypothetical protein